MQIGPHRSNPYLDVDNLNSLALDQHDGEHGVVQTHT